MSAGIKANNDGSAAIQVGGTDYITISSAGAVAIPVSLTIAGQPAGGDYVMNTYVAPATWTKPTGLKAIKVTVVGSGGNGGSSTSNPTNAGQSAGGGGGGGAAICYFDAPAVPGSPITITAGVGTNSFGPLVSATSGTDGGNGAVGVPGTAGVGGTGTVPSPAPSGAIAFSGSPGAAGGPTSVSPGYGGHGGSSGIFASTMIRGGAPNTAGVPTNIYGGGAGGAGSRVQPTATNPSGTGAPGIVIIEEFY
jgi:hypothetical protein